MRRGTSLALTARVKRLLAVLAACLTLAAAAPADAQTENRFAIGAELTIAATDHASDQDRGHSSAFPELLWRFGDIQPGWGPHWGLNWYSLDVDRSVGGAPADLGELHIRPIMVGYGYTWLRDRKAISANVLGGYAFSSMKLASGAADAYQTRMGLQATGADASNTFVFRPEIDYWYDINKLFGFNINVGYMVARPDVAITTSAGIDKRTARADQFQLRVGLVYSIF